MEKIIIIQRSRMYHSERRVIISAYITIMIMQSFDTVTKIKAAL